MGLSVSALGAGGWRKVAECRILGGEQDRRGRCAPSGFFSLLGEKAGRREVYPRMAKAEGAKPGIKIIAENRRARAEFFIEESYEAGLVLTGTEVKSLREGRANLKEAFGEVREGEAWLVDCHISPYGQGNIFNHAPTRPRKLLLHKDEIKRLLGRTQEKGFTLVPLKMYFSKGKAKVEMGLGKGKKLHDRREELKERAASRDVERALRERNKG